MLQRKNQIELLNKEIAVITQEIEDVKDEIDSWGYDWKKELAEREQGLYNGEEE